MAKTSVLFVCMGNICRSPTAEGVFRARAEAAGLDLHIDSAGTHGYHIGDPPDARSVAHAAKRGVDISGLRARQVEAADFARFDHVLAMDAANMARLKAICPAPYQHKLAMFHREREVPDPYYGGPHGFEEVLDIVEAASEAFLQRLKPLRP